MPYFTAPQIESWSYGGINCSSKTAELFMKNQINLKQNIKISEKGKKISYKA